MGILHLPSGRKEMPLCSSTFEQAHVGLPWVLSLVDWWTLPLGFFLHDLRFSVESSIYWVLLISIYVKVNPGLLPFALDSGESLPCCNISCVTGNRKGTTCVVADPKDWSWRPSIGRLEVSLLTVMDITKGGNVAVPSQMLFLHVPTLDQAVVFGGRTKLLNFREPLASC